MWRASTTMSRRSGGWKESYGRRVVVSWHGRNRSHDVWPVFRCHSYSRIYTHIDRPTEFSIVSHPDQPQLMPIVVSRVSACLVSTPTSTPYAICALHDNDTAEKFKQKKTTIHPIVNTFSREFHLKILKEKRKNMRAFQIITEFIFLKADLLSIENMVFDRRAKKNEKG